jgi:uncharacterized protein DUF6165
LKRKRPQGGGILIRVTPGDLLDRISILRLKHRHTTDPDRLRVLAAALNELERAQRAGIAESAQLKTLEKNLAEINLKLWNCEDRVRLLEKAGDFGPKFIKVARSIHRYNDRRIAIKSAINARSRAGDLDMKVYALGKTKER